MPIQLPILYMVHRAGYREVFDEDEGSRIGHRLETVHDAGLVWTGTAEIGV